jgi:hypothetical protein
MSASNYVHLDDVTIKRETDKALLIVWEGEEFWIPLSQIADAGDYHQGDEHCNLSITEWIAKQKGIEVD